MKVALVTSFPECPTRPHGGVEAVSVNLAAALARFDDLDVHVVTTDRACQAATCDTWEGVTVHRLPWRGRKVLQHATGPGRRDVIACLEQLRPDVIHAHDIYGIMVRGMGVPRVFTIHGFIHADTLEAGGKSAWIRSRMWRRVEHANWADQPHIVSISPYVRERLGGIARGVIHDIDNPIAESFFDVQRAETEPTVFSAALICPRKNTLGLIEALGRLKTRGIDARLRLAGAISDEKYGRRVRERIDRLGIADRVELLGSISRDDIMRELAGASAFALVSFEEGSPMGIEEAMAAGVPIVTSNRCGMPYMVRDGESGFLVDPNDPEDIADRLSDLFRNPDRRRAMSERCRQTARDRFHPVAVAGRTREVYHRAVRDHARSNGNGRR